MSKPQLPKGHVSILSSAFKYTPAGSTDLAKTFARVRQQQKGVVQPPDQHVFPLRRRGS